MGLLNVVYRVQGISLKWKLLIPFLGLAFVGTVSLVYIGLASQYRLIRAQEKKEIRGIYKVFLSEIEHRKAMMLSIASMIASDEKVVELLKAKNREGLLKWLRPLYENLRKEFGISILHLHLPPGRSFLRVHDPDAFGEMIAYRKSVMDALKSRRPVTALEWGISGLAIRAVVPIISQHSLIGGAEAGYPFGRPFLLRLKRMWGADFTVYERKGRDSYVRISSTRADGGLFLSLTGQIGVSLRRLSILVAPPGFSDVTILLGPIFDIYGDVVGVVEIDVDRSTIEHGLIKTKRLMVLVALIGVGLSFLLTWFIASLFVRPIKEIVKEAQEIAEGVRGTRLEERPQDEVGHLSRSLNVMLESLKERQRQIEQYAHTLELRVKERTADLVASEEKYRTLVDNLPLVVYRILEDGTAEFINPYFTEKLGYTPEEVVGNRGFWRTVICGNEDNNMDIIQACWRGRKEFRVERVVKSKEGHPYVFIDQAMPMRDKQGNIKWIDGIMLDITELKRLQERALRGEEIRIVGEMSARFAHELRNPLVTAGGFARRLVKALPEEDQRRKFAEIIVEQVSRLENILRIMLSSIEPIRLSVTEVDLGDLVSSCLEDLKEDLEKKDVALHLDIEKGLPPIHADEGLLIKAFEGLLQHALALIPPGEALHVEAKRDNDSLAVIIRHRAVGLDEEDIEQFFLPRQIECMKETAVELPLSKLIIHRHGGKIDVFQRRYRDEVVLKIELPLST